CKMEATKRLLEALKELKKAELKEFIWHLCNGVAADIEPIPRGNLEEADRQDVVDCMVEQYSDDAGKITVQVLRNIKQNNLANHLESKLQEGVCVCVCVNIYIYIYIYRHEIKILSKSQRKGSALLITNIVFDYEVNNRPGAEIDEENMEWLLRALGYNVEKRRNLSGEVHREVRNFSKLLSGHRDADSTFVVIMSHGARINNKDAILGVHYHLSRNPNDVYFVDETFSHLNSVNCPALIDKPKVILINACRGGVEVPDQVPRPDTWVHWKTDFVCFMSTVPDTASYRNTKTGSHFINYILDVFCECAHEDDLMELFRKVTNCMATRPGRTFDKLLPCLERTSLTKKFYLFPGL
uniref:Caspase-1-B-like n=1 Tax=Sinocyclocheilus rhinocerous TaxID=307959 RepID=A0A673KJR3_9TELE